MNNIPEFKTLEEAKEFYNNNKANMDSIFKIRFSKRLYSLADKLGLLNYQHLLNKIKLSSRVMDLEFLRALINRLSDKPTSIISIFKGYTKDVLGVKIVIPENYNMFLDKPSFFSKLLENNTIDEVITILEIIEEVINRD